MNAKIFLYSLVRLCVWCFAGGGGGIYILEYVAVVLLEMELIHLFAWRLNQKVKHRYFQGTILRQ